MLDDIKIMQFADGTLNSDEREHVKNEIDNNPEYQKILKDYMQTADTLAGLGNEIRSLDLPEELKLKISNFNKKESASIPQKSFNFFNIFNLKYSAVAVAFALFFTGGFYTNQMIALKDQVPTMQTVADKGSIKLRGSSSETVSNFYRWFDENKFITAVNNKINSLKNGDKFTADITDLNNQTVNFRLDKDFNDKDGNQCKIISYDKKVSLEQSNKFFFISLAVCKNNNIWKLVAITLN